MQSPHGVSDRQPLYTSSHQQVRLQLQGARTTTWLDADRQELYLQWPGVDSDSEK